MTELVVRRLLIDLETPLARHWCGGDAFRTALFNALSMSFPVGEQFFIDAVRDGHKANVMAYGVCDFMKQCVAAKKEACRNPNMDMRRVGTPFLPLIEGGGDAPHPLAEGEGVMVPIASASLMKILCGARLARRDLL